jgi:hypothetical protein
MYTPIPIAPAQSGLILDLNPGKSRELPTPALAAGAGLGIRHASWCPTASPARPQANDCSGKYMTIRLISA